MNDIDTETPVTNAELLAQIEQLKALILPMVEFIDNLQTVLSSHPMAKALGL